MVKEAQLTHESARQTPFAIRAHHLSYYLQIIKPENCWEYSISQEPVTPKELANTICNTLINDHSGTDIWSKNLSMKNVVDFTNKTQAVFERFLSLPNDYPVEIFEAKEDEICSECPVKLECRKSPPKSALTDNIFRNINNRLLDFLMPLGSDTQFINGFIKIAKSLDLPISPVVKEKILFTNIKKVYKGRQIQTTAGTVKNVLAQIKIDSFLNQNYRS